MKKKTEEHRSAILKAFAKGGVNKNYVILINYRLNKTVFNLNGSELR
jgi:hypothetical protein